MGNMAGFKEHNDQDNQPGIQQSVAPADEGTDSAVPDGEGLVTDDGLTQLDEGYKGDSLSRREQTMDDIVAAARAARNAAEGIEVEEETPEPEPTPAVEELETEVLATGDEGVAQPASDNNVDDLSDAGTQLTEDPFVAERERLLNAAAAVERREAQIEQHMKQLEQMRNPQISDDEMREKVKAMLTKSNGFEPEADEIEPYLEFAKAISAAQVLPVQQNTADINQQVQAALEEAEFKRELKTAQEEYTRDNRDIVDNPEYRETASSFSAQLRRTRPQLSVAENLKETAKLTRGFHGLKDPNDSNTQQDMQDRVSRKRAATEQNPRPAQARQAKPAEPKPPSRSELVNRMRVARGQPPI